MLFERFLVIVLVCLRMYYLLHCGHALFVTMWPWCLQVFLATVLAYTHIYYLVLCGHAVYMIFLVTVQLRKQRAAKDEYRHRLGAGVLRQGGANEVTVAEMVDMSKARKQREPVARPGLPGSGKEVSQMLQMVLPPLYTEVLIPFCEEEARNRSK